MAEEQAYLVRGRSDSDNSSKLGSFGSISRQKTKMTYSEGAEGSGEPDGVHNMSLDTGINNSDTHDGGELIDYDECTVLSQFHEDALRQAGCGLYQLRVILSCGLALAASSVELAAIPFVLPSAEIELCIQPTQKSWLLLISLVGLSAGSASYGGIASRVSRRRALLSALAVNGVFAVIAALMPTYGTAMCARFCSALGSGGIIPISYSYLSEHVSRRRRQMALPPLLLAAGLGAGYAWWVARAVVPDTGVDTLIEDKQHFSAWHRYLLLCTLPIFAALISLLWTHESPRFLLEMGRDVDAMTIYQNMHSCNKSSICGSTACAVDTEYRLAELHLPTKRQRERGAKVFWKSFFQIFSPTYLQTTATLAGTMVFAMAIQFYLSAYVPSIVLKMENERFEASRQIVENQTFTNEFYNKSINNIEYINSTFVKSTFRDMFMTHITFTNCSFYDVTFTNIKTSYVTFKGSMFFNTNIIDSDISVPRDMYECQLNDSMVRGMAGRCPRDLAFRLAPLYAELGAVHLAASLAAVPALLPPRIRHPVILSAICVLMSPGIYFAQSETTLYIIEAAYKLSLSLVFFTVCVMIVESYPTHLRCCGHGIILSLGYIGALIGRGAGFYPSAAAAAALVAAAAAGQTAVAFRLNMPVQPLL